MARFIDFLTKKSKLIREIGELTGLKKSQIHCYKKIIKFNKTEDLRTTAFRKVLKSCNDSVSPRQNEILTTCRAPRFANEDLNYSKFSNKICQKILFFIPPRYPEGDLQLTGEEHPKLQTLLVCYPVGSGPLLENSLTVSFYILFLQIQKI